LILSPPQFALQRPDILLEIITNEADCEQIWRSIVQPRGIQDIWEYRCIWMTIYSGKPFFLCAKVGDEIVGFLPLEDYRETYGYFWYFGGGHYLERSRCFIRPEWQDLVAPFLYEHLPPKVKLLYIDAGELRYFPRLVPMTETYYLDCMKIHFNLDEFFENMTKLTRKSVKRDLRKIQDLNPEILINRFQDIEQLIHFNQIRFGNDSTLRDHFHEAAIRSLTVDPRLRPYLRMISVFIQGDLKACAYAFFCNNVYTYFIGGNDVDIPNLAKYLVYCLFQDGIQLGASRIDVMADDCGWKEHWHLEKEPQYQLFT
jgi:hypothetical protein